MEGHSDIFGIKESLGNVSKVTEEIEIGKMYLGNLKKRAEEISLQCAEEIAEQLSWSLAMFSAESWGNCSADFEVIGAILRRNKFPPK